MIRTYRPRGSYWNCASTFQQRQDYRQIDFSDDVPAPAEILHEDGCRCSDPSVRASKRRRLKKLATSFINGSPLEISSARTREVIRSNVIPVVEESVWADVLDDREYLEAYLAHQELDSNKSGKGMRQKSQARVDPADREIVITRSSNLRTSRANRSPLMRNPSLQALEAAAQIRERAIQKRIVLETQPSMPLVHEHDEDHHVESLTTTEESTALIQSSPTAAWTSSRWLRSRPPLPRRKAVDEDCSRDELGMSSAATQSQTCRNALLPSLSTPHDALTFSSAKSHISPVEDEPMLTIGSKSDSHCGSQSMTSGLSSLPSLAPQISNGYRSTDRNETQDSNISGPEHATTSQVDVHVETTATGSDGEGSVTVSAGNTEALGRPKMGGNALDRELDDPVSRRRSSPSRSQQAARRKTRVSATEETSPFQFRKTIKRTTDGNSDIAVSMPEPRSPQRLQSAMLVSDGDESRPETHSVRRESANDGEDSSLTPLADKHLNRLIRSNSGSGNSTTLRDQLREDLVRSGAVLTTAIGVPDADLSENSSYQSNLIPGGDPEHSESSERELIAKHLETESQRWPGTQFLLTRAQQDLFASPDKCDSDTTLAGSSTSKSFTLGENDATSTRKRKALARFSQGQLPSTQALLDGWQGWSTIKKPRDGRQSMNSLQSPTLGKGKRKPGSEVETSRRGSNLRFSFLGPDSPLMPRSDPIHRTDGPSSMRRVNDSNMPQGSTSQNNSVESSVDHAYGSAASRSQLQSTSSKGRGPDGDSLGRGQEDSQPRLSLETTELDSTIIKLTNNVLGDAFAGSF